MRSHVLLQQSLPQVSLVAELTLEGSLSAVLVLPHVIDKVALGHKLFLAHLTLKGLLSLMLNPRKGVKY